MVAKLIFNGHKSLKQFATILTIIRISFRQILFRSKLDSTTCLFVNNFYPQQFPKIKQQAFYLIHCTRSRSGNFVTHARNTLSVCNVLFLVCFRYGHWYSGDVIDDYGHKETSEVHSHAIALYTHRHTHYTYSSGMKTKHSSTCFQ
jgi:hypothetical protein